MKKLLIGLMAVATLGIADAYAIKCKITTQITYEGQRRGNGSGWRSTNKTQCIKLINERLRELYLMKKYSAEDETLTAGSMKDVIDERKNAERFMGEYDAKVYYRLHLLENKATTVLSTEIDFSSDIPQFENDGEIYYIPYDAFSIGYKTSLDCDFYLKNKHISSNKVEFASLLTNGIGIHEEIAVDNKKSIHMGLSTRKRYQEYSPYYLVDEDPNDLKLYLSHGGRTRFMTLRDLANQGESVELKVRKRNSRGLRANCKVTSVENKITPLNAI